MLDTTEILNEIELDKILSFTADKVMFEAVKKYLLVYLYRHGVAVPGQPHQGNLNWAMQRAFNAITPVSMGGMPATDEELGADLRAVAKGVQVIESGFKELSDIKREKPELEAKANPAE